MMGALCASVTFSAQPTSSDTSSADRMAWPVIAPNRDSGMTLVTNSTAPNPFPGVDAGDLAGVQGGDVDIHALRRV